MADDMEGIRMSECIKAEAMSEKDLGPGSPNFRSMAFFALAIAVVLLAVFSVLNSQPMSQQNTSASQTQQK